MKLYEIADNYKALLDLDIDEQTLADTLESIDGDLEEKADSICHVLANMDSDIAALDVEAKRLMDRKKVFSNRKDSLKDYLRTQMESIEKKKIETTKFTINCVAGRDILNVLDESKIPDDFFTIIPESRKLDKQTLLANMKKRPDELESFEGAELIKSKSSLRIK